MVTATVAVTEKEAGARPSIYREVDVNDLFCNSKEKEKILGHTTLSYAYCVMTCVSSDFQTP